MIAYFEAPTKDKYALVMEMIQGKDLAKVIAHRHRHTHAGKSYLPMNLYRARVDSGTLALVLGTLCLFWSTENTR